MLDGKYSLQPDTLFYAQGLKVKNAQEADDEENLVYSVKYLKLGDTPLVETKLITHLGQEFEQLVALDHPNLLKVHRFV